MKRYSGLIVVLFCLYSVCCIAQTIDFSENDCISVLKVFSVQTDTVRVDSLVNEEIQPIKGNFKPNSKKAVLYSTFFPGLGQIYNRKYWKLPLVYGGFIGCVYAINWNGSQYNGYKRAYIDFIDDDPNTNSWEDYRYGSYRRQDPEDWTADMKRNFVSTLQSTKDFHRRNRDLSYIITVGVYAIWIIDAYVDAQLFDFDISPDLSLQVVPLIYNKENGYACTLGMQLSFAF